ncbi:MAG: chlorite dismutase family protein [Silanimonas sp.]|jgi:chlorite dismutase|nr:chlorite dismutase family protein [Silanimonas sp.]
MVGVVNPHRVAFIGGDEGPWRITAQTTFRGEALPSADRLAWSRTATRHAAGKAWSLVGFSSNLRYASRVDVADLRRAELRLPRREATFAALIPIRKSQAWWRMAQDEREQIFRRDSQHSAIGQAHAGHIARKLFHARDLGGPFDFLTWFEFEPEAAGRFDALLSSLRATPEWEYVDREVELRLIRERTEA